MHLCSTSTRTNMWKGTGRLEKKKPVHFPMYPTFSSSPLWLDSRLRCDKCIPLYLKEKKSLFLFFRGLHVQRAMLPNNLPVHSLHSIKSAPALTHTHTEISHCQDPSSLRQAPTSKLSPSSCDITSHYSNSDSTQPGAELTCLTI